MQSRPTRAPRAFFVIAIVTLITLTFFAVRAASPSTTPTANAAGGLGLAYEPYATGFFQLTDISNAGDERLFVTQRAGLIEVVDGAGNTLPTPFLDIQGAPRVCTDQGYQLGMLGLAFDPDYTENGYFFVNYVTAHDGEDCNNGFDTVIARFKVSADPNVADVNSEEIVLRLELPLFGDNAAGDLVFGPDGYLYIPTGDGGGPRNPDGPAQDGDSLLGKILRIDVSTSDTGPLYTIPADNPFINDPAIRDEIWAIGVRNPWRASFDRLNGNFYFGDVGEHTAEEINLSAFDSNGGANYGWPCYEGTYVFTDTTCGPTLPPVYEGLRSEPGGVWTAVIGGFIYRGNEYPLLNGYYVFGDVGGRTFTLRRDGQGNWVRTDEALIAKGLATFGEGADGELYAGTYTFGEDTVYHVVDPRPQPTVTPTATVTQTPTATATASPTATTTVSPIPEEQFLYLPLIQRGEE